MPVSFMHWAEMIIYAFNQTMNVFITLSFIAENYLSDDSSSSVIDSQYLVK